MKLKQIFITLFFVAICFSCSKNEVSVPLLFEVWEDSDGSELRFISINNDERIYYFLDKLDTTIVTKTYTPSDGKEQKFSYKFDTLRFYSDFRLDGNNLVILDSILLCEESVFVVSMSSYTKMIDFRFEKNNLKSMILDDPHKPNNITVTLPDNSVKIFFYSRPHAYDKDHNLI